MCEKSVNGQAMICITILDTAQILHRQNKVGIFEYHNGHYCLTSIDSVSTTKPSLRSNGAG